MKEPQITEETEVSTTELACVLGISGRRIRQMAEDGELIKRSRGRFNLCESVRRYISSKAREDQSDEDTRLEKARRAADVTLKASKAQIVKMEADELRGKMHRSEDVAALTADLLYEVRSALIALPGRLAVDVAQVQSAAEASDLIRREVNRTLKEISQYRYDPRKYEERVRNRMDWDSVMADADDGS